MKRNEILGYCMMGSAIEVVTILLGVISNNMLYAHGVTGVIVAVFGLLIGGSNLTVYGNILGKEEQ